MEKSFLKRVFRLVVPVVLLCSGVSENVLFATLPPSLRPELVENPSCHQRDHGFVGRCIRSLWNKARKREEKKIAVGDHFSRKLAEAVNEYKSKALSASDLYARLSLLWSATFPATSVDEWKVQSEIADIVDSLYQKDKAFSLFELPSGGESSVSSLKGHQNAFIDFAQISDICDLLDHPGSPVDWQDILGRAGYVTVEKAFMPWLIRHAYGSDMWTARALRSTPVLTSLTRTLERDSHVTGNAAEIYDDIAKFSLRMGIAPWETLKNSDGKKVVRGFTWYFGTSARKFKNLNRWFIRHWSENAKKAILVQKSRDVIASADSKIRIRFLAKGKINSSQSIVGKVLNREAMEKARQNHDDPFYYGGKYPFRVSDLLGVAPELSVVNPGLEEKKNGSGWAGQSLMNLLYQELLQESFIQIIQRLAPSDIHNFVVPFSGKALSNREMLLFLRSKRQARAAESGAQAAEMQKLLKYFETEEVRLQRPSQNYTGITGTLHPVSFESVSRRPEILATNSRKVMLLKHKGSSFSLHVFIGATGVGNVRTDPVSGIMSRGQALGHMTFGEGFSREFWQNGGFYFSESPERNQDGQPHLRAGEHLGSFPVNGSTIISFYPSSSFTPGPELSRFLNCFSAQDVIPEVRVRMGDSLLRSLQ